GPAPPGGLRGLRTHPRRGDGAGLAAAGHRAVATPPPPLLALVARRPALGLPDLAFARRPSPPAALRAGRRPARRAVPRQRRFGPPAEPRAPGRPGALLGPDPLSGHARSAPEVGAAPGREVPGGGASRAGDGEERRRDGEIDLPLHEGLPAPDRLLREEGPGGDRRADP